MRILTWCTIIAATALVALPAAAGAQEDGAAPIRQRPAVKLDLSRKAFDPALPFGEGFQLTGQIPEEVYRVSLRYGPTSVDEAGRRSTVFVSEYTFPRSDVIQQQEFAFHIRPLRANRDYLFELNFHKESTRDSTRKDTLTDKVEIIARARASLANHFDSDIGLMNSFRAGYWGLVTNAHLHVVPVNKNEELGNRPALERLAKRLSVFGGLALHKFGADDDVEPFWDVGSPVAGLGLRGIAGLDGLRVNGGIVWVKQEDTNPLVSERHTKRDGFVSVTGDVEIQKLLGPLLAILK